MSQQNRRSSTRGDNPPGDIARTSTPLLESTVLASRSSGALLISDASASLADNEILTSTSPFKNYFRFTWFWSFRVPLGVFTMILAVAFVTALLGRGICQPTYLSSMLVRQNGTWNVGPPRGADTYISVLFFSLSRFAVSLFVLFIAFLGNRRGISFRPPLRVSRLFLIGFFNFLSFLLIFYGGPPTRTPPQLQAVLVTSAVPFGVIVSRFAFGKWVSTGRLVCAFVVVVGLVISLEPVIFDKDLPKIADEDIGCHFRVSSSLHEKTAEKVGWCIVYALSFLAGAVMIVLADKEMKHAGVTEVHLLVLLAWISFVIAFFTVCFFWISFIPHPVGGASSFRELGKGLRQGLACSYGMAIGDYDGFDLRCQMATAWGWGTVVSSYTASLCFYAVTKYAANSVLSLIVQAIFTPVGAIFFMLFRICPGAHNLTWYPVFEQETQRVVYVFVGIAFMVPAAVAFKFLRGPPPPPKRP